MACEQVIVFPIRHTGDPEPRRAGHNRLPLAGGCLAPGRGGVERRRDRCHGRAGVEAGPPPVDPVAPPGVRVRDLCRNRGECRQDGPVAWPDVANAPFPQAMVRVRSDRAHAPPRLCPEVRGLMASSMSEEPPPMPPTALPALLGWRSPGGDVPPAMTPTCATPAGRIAGMMRHHGSP
jgi:hypothetical protein